MAMEGVWTSYHYDCLSKVNLLFLSSHQSDWSQRAGFPWRALFPMGNQELSSLDGVTGGCKISFLLLVRSVWWGWFNLLTGIREWISLLKVGNVCELVSNALPGGVFILRASVHVKQCELWWAGCGIAVRLLDQKPSKGCVCAAALMPA